MSVSLNANRVCLVSDIHLGIHQNSILWHTIAIKWAKWLRRELRKKNITDIVMCGDLFHYRDEVAVNTLHVATQILNLWKEFNIVMIVGNHDAYYKDRADVNSLSIIDGWPNINIISNLTSAKLHGKNCLFCPWGTTLSQIKGGDVIFGHFEIQSFKFNHYKVCDAGFKSGDLLGKSKLTISGHFHHREERKYENGKILYVGNPFQMDFGDINSTKGYYILDQETLEYEFTQNKKSPEHHKLKLSELLSAKNQNWQKKVAGNFVKFYVDQQITNDDIDALLQMLSKLKPLSLNVDYTNRIDFKVEDDTGYDFSGVDVATAIEEFINLMDVDDDKKVTEYTLDLFKRCR